MSFLAVLHRLVPAMSPSFLFILALADLILTTTYVYTTIRYRFMLSKYLSPSSKP
jgi:hypothetical protein